MSSPNDPRNGNGPDDHDRPAPQSPPRQGPAWQGQPQDQPWQPQPTQNQPWQQQPTQNQPWQPQNQPTQQQPWQPQNQPTQQQPWQPQNQPTQQQPWQPQNQPWQQPPPQDHDRQQPWQPQPQDQPWQQQPHQDQPWQQQPHQDQPWQQHQPWNQPGGPPPTQQWSGPQPAGWGGHPGDAGFHAGGAQPPQGPGHPDGPPPGQPPKKSRAALLTAVAVVVALLAGVGVYMLAVRNTAAGGQDTPVAAARQVFADIDNGDLIGLIDTFDPVEAQFANDLAGDVIAQFKRLGLLTDDATVDNATGVDVSITGITFDEAAEERPLSDLTVVKLTGGTITVNPTRDTGVETDLFRRLVDAVEKKAADQDVPMTSTSEPTTIDIAQVIRDDNDGEPIRLSIVERGGSWYPSLFYTAADYWAQSAGVGAVTEADMIGGSGAPSPSEAVDGMIAALLAEDAEAVIGLLPPDEMSAVHAYGRKIVDAIGSGDGTTEDVSLQAEWNETDVTGGTLLSIRSLRFTSGSDSGSIEIDRAAGSVTVTDGTDSQTFDADSLGDYFGAGELSSIHPDLPDFVQRMLRAVLGLGVVATEVDGLWYVSPLRSYSAIFTVLLGGMEQRDIEMFIDLLEE